MNAQLIFIASKVVLVQNINYIDFNETVATSSVRRVRVHLINSVIITVIDANEINELIKMFIPQHLKHKYLPYVPRVVS